MQCMSPACKQDAIVCCRHNCGKIDIYRATALARATHLRKGSLIKEAGRKSGNEQNTHHHYYHCCGIACHRPKVGSKSIHAISGLSFTSFNILHNNFVFHRFLYPRGYCPSERSSLQLPHPRSRATCMSKVCQEAFAKASFMAFFSNLLRHYLSVLQPDGVRNNWQIRTLGETVKQIRAWGKHPFLRVLQELGAVRYPPWPLCLGTTGTSLRDKKTIYRIIMNYKGKGADNSATNSYNFIQFQCLLEHVVYDIF